MVYCKFFNFPQLVVIQYTVGSELKCSLIGEVRNIQRPAYCKFFNVPQLAVLMVET